MMARGWPTSVAATVRLLHAPIVKVHICTSCSLRRKFTFLPPDTGKYIGVNPRLVYAGSDRSQGLAGMVSLEPLLLLHVCAVVTNSHSEK